MLPIKEKWKQLQRSKVAKMLNYGIHNVSLPGNAGVPLYDVVAYLFKGIGDGSVWRASKGLAFSFLSAMPPLLIFIFTLIAFLPFDGLQDELLLQMQDIIPDKFFQPIASTINDVMGHKHTSLLSIGFVSSIILAANAMHGMMMYAAERNENCGMERRKFPERYALCIAMVFMIYIMVVLVLVFLIGYRTILMWMFRNGWLIPGSFTHVIIGVGRWVIMLAFSLITITTIYYLIPRSKHRVGFFSPGAVFAVGMFILLSWGFRIFLAHFDQYNLLYGSIGTLLVIMLWLFLNCLVLMLGYELNVAISNGKLNGQTVRHKLEKYKK